MKITKHIFPITFQLHSRKTKFQILLLHGRYNPFESSKIIIEKTIRRFQSDYLDFPEPEKSRATNFE